MFYATTPGAQNAHHKQFQLNNIIMFHLQIWQGLMKTLLPSSFCKKCLWQRKSAGTINVTFSIRSMLYSIFTSSTTSEQCWMNWRNSSLQVIFAVWNLLWLFSNILLTSYFQIRAVMMSLFWNAVGHSLIRRTRGKQGPNCYSLVIFLVLFYQWRALLLISPPFIWQRHGRCL